MRMHARDKHLCFGAWQFYFQVRAAYKRTGAPLNELWLQLQKRRRNITMSKRQQLEKKTPSCRYTPTVAAPVLKAVVHKLLRKKHSFIHHLLGALTHNSILPKRGFHKIQDWYALAFLPLLFHYTPHDATDVM